MVDEGGMLVADHPLLPERPVALVNIAEKGYLTLTLVATGAGGHSSNPPKVSTIGRLSTALARIEDNPFQPRLVEPVKAMFEHLAPHLGQPERFVFSNLWLTGWLVADQMAEDRLTLPFVRTTGALTMINAGIKENVVPQRAEAKVNFRLLPGDTQETVLGYIEELIDDPAIEISYDRWDNVPPVAAYDGGGFEVIRRAIESVYPQAVVTPSLLTATTDTRHYVDLAEHQYRFHGVLIDSSQASSVHGTNEFITVESFTRSIAIAREMLRLGAGPGHAAR
jgi:carboxypeptidase PM20D1